MIPRVSLQSTLSIEVEQFLKRLEHTPFAGEIRADFASRLLASTDNSIYQIVPQAVLHPRTAEDVVQVFQLAAQPAFQSITFSPRGGGTGTNGQSLSSGIILDCSKYMRQILEVNLAEGWVRVQPGVVLDQLNTHLRADGVFFAPNLSPSSRATLGGMINTDACGKGSRIYGRTSDHILELTWVLTDGTVGSSSAISGEQLSQQKASPGRLGQIYHQVDESVTQHQELIAQQFPKMPRFLTGYNLAKVYGTRGFDLNRILAGSEGTLAVITEAKLKLTPIPHHKVMFVIHYGCFDDALNAAQSLLNHAPAAIETIDDTILELARQNEIYDAVKDFIGEARSINLVEFVSDDLATLQARADQLQQQIEQMSGQAGQPTGYYCTGDALEIQALWELRKRGVGLLGNRTGPRKPVAFVEDTAVPPAHLASYVQDFQALLDRYGLDYAMFGHVDVGCLHVRPALDLQAPQDESLIREISDQVVALVRQYGGVMWAEHGRGFRSEYTIEFFGETLYQELRKIKAVFDPDNRLNPGKIVTPLGTDDPVVSLESPMRGQFDRQVPEPWQSAYQVAFSCNGNGACFNTAPEQVMCPSYQGALDRIHSPKGRAMLLREWLRLLANSSSDSYLEQSAGNILVKLWHTLAKAAGRYDYSQEVYDGLHGCLSCKACATQCPIHVDIPSLKAQFLHRYYGRYLRSHRDYLMGHIETLAQWQAAWFPAVTNVLLQTSLVQALLRMAGIVDAPSISLPTVAASLAARDAATVDLDKPPHTEESHNSVVLLLDNFSCFYEAPLVLATYDLLTQLGFQVQVSPPPVSGKPLHVLGFLDRFESVAQQTRIYLEQLQSMELPIIGIEPSIVLTFRDEYAQWGQPLPVQLPQEFLLQHLERLPKADISTAYTLLGHCTERTLAPASQTQWQQIFAAAGLSLKLESVGCCGMAGLYGHEREHLDTSRSIYDLSWGLLLPNKRQERQHYLATGFSCRSQVQRFAGWRPQHPLQVLQATLCS
ncbi:MAG: FAD-binding and (Fe-S)-binding domain-containing protein [Cyanobacteria bacterium P01_A01_bin.114]